MPDEYISQKRYARRGPRLLCIDWERCVLVGDIGWQELLIVFVILLLMFGATRLPALSKSLGQSIRGFKTGLKEDEPAPVEAAVTLAPEGEQTNPQA
jgi:sec-independent protein translocase protein TatA